MEDVLEGRLEAVPNPEAGCMSWAVLVVTLCASCLVLLALIHTAQGT